MTKRATASPGDGVATSSDERTTTALFGRERRLTVLLLASAAALLIAFTHYFAEQRGDDSFIFYRISDNLLHGLGPVYNAGERVEAYSSPAWLLVLTVARALGADFVVFSRWAGAALVALALVATYRLARRLGASANLAAGAVLAACFSGSLWYWAPSGLETPLQVAALAWTCLTLARGGSGRDWAIATAILGLARPEGVGLVPISIGCAWFLRRRLPPASQVAIAAGIPLAYFVFRFSYFGVPFPNTYYAKATGAFGKRLVAGVDYALWVLVPLALSALHLARRLRRGLSTTDERALTVLVLSGAVAGACVFGGGDWMWGKRLILPCVPPALALVAYVASSASRPWARGALMIGAAWLIDNDDLPWTDRKDYEPLFGFEAIPHIVHDPLGALDVRFARPLATLGRALSWRTMPGGSRIEGTMTVVARDVAAFMSARWPERPLTAVNHAGAIPFFTGFPVIDMTGLADAYVARGVKGGLHEKYAPDYVLSRSPRLIVLNSRVRPTPEQWYVPGYWKGETALVELDSFKAHYRPVARYWSWEYADGFTSYILLYERID
jgi:hypothetical protein